MRDFLQVEQFPKMFYFPVMKTRNIYLCFTPFYTGIGTLINCLNYILLWKGNLTKHYYRELAFYASVLFHLFFCFFFPSVPNVLNFFKKFHVAQSVVKNPPANAVDTGDLGSIPELGRSLGGGNGNPLQYSCLKNPMGWGAWQATVHGVAKNQDWATEYTHTHTRI